MIISGNPVRVFKISMMIMMILRNRLHCAFYFQIGCRVYGSSDLDSGLQIVRMEEISPVQQEMIDNEISRLLKVSGRVTHYLLPKLNSGLEES